MSQTRIFVPSDPTTITPASIGALSATDPAVTNARTPTAHTATHVPGGSDTLDYTKINGSGASLPTLPTTTWPAGTTFRLTTTGALYRSSGSTWDLIAASGGGAPALHATTHEPGGSDELLAGTMGGMPNTTQARIEIYPRHWISSQNQQGLGSVNLTFFTPAITLTISNITSFCKTAATGTPTLARMGVYSYNTGDGSVTLLARTANDYPGGTMWLSAGLFTRALAAGGTRGDGSAFPTTLQLVRGTRYAYGAIITGGTADPVFFGVAWTSGGILNMMDPRLASTVPSQTDLANSYTNGNQANTVANAWAYFT